MVWIFGAKDRARTGHPDLGKVVLYQMSYFRLIAEAFTTIFLYKIRWQRRSEYLTLYN